MNILALETATAACSAAMLTNNNIITRFELAPRQHTALILPMLEQVLADADLSKSDIDAIAFGNGPGAFTGVRIATAISQGLAFSLDVPVVPISTLAAMAQQTMDAGQATKVVTALDARMGEVYWSTFVQDEAGYAQASTEAIVIPPQEATMPAGEGWVAVGNGWGEYAAEFDDVLMHQIVSVNESVYPAAREIAKIAQRKLSQGEVQAIDKALPLYVRDTVAQVPGGTSR